MDRTIITFAAGKAVLDKTALGTVPKQYVVMGITQPQYIAAAQRLVDRANGVRFTSVPGTGVRSTMIALGAAASAIASFGCDDKICSKAQCTKRLCAQDLHDPSKPWAQYL